MSAVEPIQHSLASSVADFSPEPIPDRGAELNLFLHAPLAVPGELLQHTQRNLSALHHLEHRHATDSSFMRVCKHVALLQPFAACVDHRRTPCVARAVSLEWWGTCSSANISNIKQSLLPTTCSLPQCLAALVHIPEDPPASMQLDHWHFVVQLSSLAATTASSAQQTVNQSARVWKEHRLHSAPRTVQHLSCTRISQAHRRQRPPGPPQLTTAHHNPH